MTISRWVLVTLIIVTVAAAGCGSAATASPQAAAQTQAGSGKPARGTYSTMSSKELQAEMDAGQKLVIVDLREPELFRAGHIPGAQNIPLDQFNDRLKELNPESKIVLVCHMGPMGDQAGALLAERGYTDVWNLKGGMAAWNGRLEK